MVRRGLAVLGAGVAVTALLLSSGTAAMAKSDMSMKANHKTVRAGKSVRFTGQFGDDAGVNGDQICLWEYVKKTPVRPVAPCVPLRQRNGAPLKADSFSGYFSVTVQAKTAGRLVVVPIVKFAHYPRAAYLYAGIPIVVTHAAH